MACSKPTTPWTLYRGDALRRLASLEPESIDAIVTDPPYCAGGFTEKEKQAAKCMGITNKPKEEWFVGDNMGTAGLCFLLRSVACEALRLLKPGGSLLVFCDWRMVSALAPALESAGLRHQNLIVWDKGSIGLGRGFRPRHELVLHFTKGGSKARYFTRSGSNLIACKRVPGRTRNHPTEKPVEVFEKLLEVVCPEGGTVLDPFAGSAASGEAALRSGRNWIGVELSGEFCRKSRQRLRQVASEVAA
ncbi:MAG TPA: site-specific DNA-methyltransferase [Planctomycetes bacterium]|mgnify:CR=1 FL=1|nr:site-specific DNA-methyltransferase [Planctomycetota bacterium]